MTSKHLASLLPIAKPYCASLLFACSSASSSALDWDTSSDPGIQSGDGFWGSSNSNWSSDGTTLVPWTNDTEAAVFSGADGDFEIAMNDAEVRLTGLTFNNSGNTLMGDDDMPNRITFLDPAVITLGADTSNFIGSSLRVTSTNSVTLGQPSGQESGTLEIASSTSFVVNGTGNFSLDGLGTTLNIFGNLDLTDGQLNLGNNVPAATPGIPSTDVTVVLKNGGIVRCENNTAHVGYTSSMNADPNDVQGTLIVELGGVAAFQELRLGQFGTGILEIQTGGYLQADTILLGNEEQAQGFLNHEGLLIVSNLDFLAANSQANFDGGVLQVAGHSDKGLLSGSNGTANIRTGGLTIDTVDFDADVAKELLHSALDGDPAIDGGLTKQGSGTLTLSAINTYTGPTRVSAGTLALASGDALNDAGGLIIEDGAIVSLESSEAVKTLHFGEIPQSPGTYGAAGSGATNVSSRFTGSGILTVLPIEEPNDPDEIIISEITLNETGDVTLTWNSQPGEQYTLCSSDDLVDWDEIESPFASGGTATTVTLSGDMFPLDTNPTQLFFRVIETP